MKTTKDKIEVMQAYLEGNIIEITWDWAEYNYEVKKEPLVRYLVSNQHNDIVVQYSNLVSAKGYIEKYGHEKKFRIIKLVEDTTFNEEEA